ncbi:MAG: LamG domain-containing protein [Bacteroidetes bacterium]|nr:LamG domain-containing protein [Bacteroidota bacterium]
MKTLYLSLLILLFFINSCFSQNQTTKVIVISIQNEANNNYSLKVVDGQVKFDNVSNLTLLDPKNSIYKCYIKGTRCDIKLNNQLNLIHPTYTIVLLKSIPYNMQTISIYNPQEKRSYKGNTLSQLCFSTYRHAQESGRWEDESVSGLAVECTLIRIAEEIGNNIWGSGQWFLENIFIDNKNIISKQGLIAYYPFNGNANDESGNNNNGTEMFGQVSYINGYYLQAISFSGIKNPGHLRIPNSTSLQFSNAVSFSLWIKLNDPAGMDIWGHSSSNGCHVIFAKDHDKPGGFCLGITQHPDNKLEVLFHNDISYHNRNISLIGNSHYNLGDWIHIGITISSNEGKLYLNGSLSYTTNLTSNPNFTIANSKDLYLGKFRDTWFPFNGAIDEFRIYNRTLNESEIQKLYHQDYR